jgi:hypothetical protein
MKTHVVAIGILNECQRIVRDLINKLNALMIRSMIDATLKNTTAMSMSSDLDTVCCYCIVYELGMTKSRA